MKRIPFSQRQPGDLFLAAVPSLTHDLIWAAEKVLHPRAPMDFEATHAGIIGFNGFVVEAWWDLHGDNSVAALFPDSKYATSIEYLELWRATSFLEQGLVNYIQEYGPAQYGLLNLSGFLWMALVKGLTGKDIANPEECSDVCSQGALIELGLFQVSEPWAIALAASDEFLRICDPLLLRTTLLAHETT